jgi:hypothetical protein
MGTTGRPADSGLVRCQQSMHLDHQEADMMLFWKNKVVPSWSHFTVLLKTVKIGKWLDFSTKFKFEKKKSKF